MKTRKEYVMSKQVLRSGTRIGANIREAQHAQSRKDFLSKMYIALKECAETLYWLELLTVTEYLASNESRSITKDARELYYMLQSITKTTKENMKEDKT